MSERDRSRGAELRAGRVGWKGRSRNMSQASRSMDKRLRKMRDQGSYLESYLDRRLHRHSEETKRWHMAWDGPGRSGG